MRYSEEGKKRTRRRGGQLKRGETLLLIGDILLKRGTDSPKKEQGRWRKRRLAFRYGRSEKAFSWLLEEERHGPQKSFARRRGEVSPEKGQKREEGS